MTAVSSSSSDPLVLEIYLDGYEGVVGRLAHTGLETTFAYDFAYVRSERPAALSLSLPVANDVYGPRQALPFFENLLPEGKRLSVIALQLGLDAQDLMGILDHIGRDCPGAVSIVRAGEAPAKTPGEFPGDYAEILPTDLIELLDKGIDRTAPKGEGQPFSLAGVQGKAAVLMDDRGRFYRALRGAPSTHIVKLPDHNFTGMVVNEAFCLELARAMGLDAIEPRIVTLAPGRDVLVVPRYDRTVENLVPAEDGDGIAPPSADGVAGPATIRRLHQEDFCQALGFTAGRKYTHHGGPAGEDLLRVDKVDAPAAFRLALLDAMIFNFLVGNADAHAKNYSLLHDRGSRTRLAPLYDVLSIALYPDYRQRMALTLGAEEGVRDMGFDDFGEPAVQLAARRLRMRPSIIRERFETAARKIIRIAEGVQARNRSYGPVAVRVISVIGRQIGLLNDAFGFDIPVDVIEFTGKSGGWQTSS